MNMTTWWKITVVVALDAVLMLKIADWIWSNRGFSQSRELILALVKMLIGCIFVAPIHCLLVGTFDLSAIPNSHLIFSGVVINTLFVVGQYISDKYQERHSL